MRLLTVPHAAMTQTTLIGGLGLCVFGLSPFTPTQRFGILMLFLLVAALIGDLIFLPALLAGPLGKLFTFKGTGDRQLRRDQPVPLSTKEQLKALEEGADVDQLDEDVGIDNDPPPDLIPDKPTVVGSEKKGAENSSADESPKPTGKQSTPHSGLKEANRKRRRIDSD